MSKADRRAAKKARSREAKAERVRREIWGCLLDEPIVMVECESCGLEQVLNFSRPKVVPCLCKGLTAVYV